MMNDMTCAMKRNWKNLQIELKNEGTKAAKNEYRRGVHTKDVHRYGECSRGANIKRCIQSGPEHGSRWRYPTRKDFESESKTLLRQPTTATSEANNLRPGNPSTAVDTLPTHFPINSTLAPLSLPPHPQTPTKKDMRDVGRNKGTDP